MENVFDGLSPGDKVKVEWNFKLSGSKESYGKRGTIEQITPTIAIRTVQGNVFCINHYHIKIGTTIKKIGVRAARKKCKRRGAKTHGSTKIYPGGLYQNGILVAAGQRH